MPAVNLYVEADVACWTSGIAAGQGPHLPVGYYGGAVYRSAMRFPIPAWAGWTSISSATLTFYISNHAHVAPSGGTHYVSRQNVGSLWTKGAGGADCDADGFTGGNNTQNSDIPSTSTDRASFLCGVTANASKTVDVTAAINYYRNNGSSKIVFVFEASGSGEYTEIWASEKAGYDAVLTINYVDASPPNAPTLVAPAAGLASVDDTPTFSWTHSDVQGNPQTNAEVRIYDAAGTTLLYTWPVAGAAATLDAPVALTRGTTYQWEARTQDLTGWGPYATKRSFSIKALPVVTITPTRFMEFSGGAPRLRVKWTVTGGTQATYRVTGGGYDSTVKTGADLEHLLSALALVNGTAVSVTVAVTTDEGLAGSATLSFTPRFGLTTHKKTLAGVPINWQTPVVTPASQPAGTQLVVEYGSAALAADAVPTAWFTSIASVPKTQYLHWRAWFIPSASVGPTLDTLLIQYDQTAAVLDKWKLPGGAVLAAPWYVDTGEYVYGSRSAAVACSGSVLSIVSETIRLRQGRSYIISGLIKSDGNSGATYQLMAPQAGSPFGTPISNAAGLVVQTDPVTETRNWYQSDLRDVRRYRSPVYVATGDIDVQVWCRVSGANGTKAWFDAVKLEESTVATPWGPSAVGAVVLDAGGLQVDAQKDGIFRLRGSNGLPSSVIELGPAGLYQGGALLGGGTYVGNDPPAAPSNGQLWWDDDDASTAGSGASGKGTSFPLTPALYDIFFRTDLRMEFFWDGTRWLSTQLVSFYAINDVALPYTVNSGTRMAISKPALCSDIWLESVDMWFYVSGGTALSASHKWALAVQKVPGSTTLGTFTIDSGALNVHRAMPQMVVGQLLGSGTFLLDIPSAKTGTPGSLFFSVMALARYVAV